MGNGCAANRLLLILLASLVLSLMNTLLSLTKYLLSLNLAIIYELCCIRPYLDYCKKNLAVYNTFKDDIRHLAGLKQQISQKMILLVQHIALMSLCCEVISSFVIFAVLYLRVGGCRPERRCKLLSFLQ